VLRLGFYARIKKPDRAGGISSAIGLMRSKTDVDAIGGVM
jgi:hypothetical protein